MYQTNRILLVLVVTLLASLLLVSLASAHNGGHIILPDGTCINVGSLAEAPTVGECNPNQLDNGQLDLIPGPGDQFGARYAAAQGSSAVLPGECP